MLILVFEVNMQPHGMGIIYSALNNSKMCNNTMEFRSIIYNNKSTYTDLRYFFKNSWQAIYIYYCHFFSIKTQTA